MIFNFFPKKTAEEYLAKAKRRQDNRHIKPRIAYWDVCEYISKAKAIEPNNPKVYLFSCMSNVEFNIFDKAISDASKCIELDSRCEYNATCYFLRGFSFFYKKKLNESIADLKIAISIDPNNNLAKECLEKFLKVKNGELNFEDV